MERDEIRDLLRERCLVQEPPVQARFGIFRYGEKGEETPVFFVKYLDVLTAAAWNAVQDGDSLSFFFEEKAVNIAFVDDGKIQVSLCVDERTKNYPAFRASLAVFSSLNILITHDRGGLALVIGRGVNGRYRVAYREQIAEESLPAFEKLQKEIDEKETAAAPGANPAIPAGANGS